MCSRRAYLVLGDQERAAVHAPTEAEPLLQPKVVGSSTRHMTWFSPNGESAFWAEASCSCPPCMAADFSKCNEEPMPAQRLQLFRQDMWVMRPSALPRASGSQQQSSRPG